MLNSKSFLAVDFGAGSLKLAEFEQNEAGGLRLKQYGVKPLGAEGAQEATREKAVLEGLQELFSEKSYGSRNVNVCAPGFHVFSKFVKLPPVDTSKVTQIIQYEAQQNVPFPLSEVVWDYQILGTSPTGELEVLLVAIKTDVVEGLFRVADGAGSRLQLVDVSPAALCNAFRYNYGDLEGCTMLLDIGAKTSNLLFFEGAKVYARTIPIGANAITQEFMTESKMTFAQAEAFKVEQGFVSLGGAYEEPDDPRQAAVSKIARQVMTRLHIQVNQTIQFYRTQQGGSAPQRLFLSGGASIMPYAAQFFSEKLNVEVDYFNPFRNVQIDPALDLDDLSKVAHSFGEVVGLGLRNLAHCPVELNLMPRSSIQRQELTRKKPYFLAAAYAVVLVMFALGLGFQQRAAAKREKIADIEQQVAPLLLRESEFDRFDRSVKSLKKSADQINQLAENRFYWAAVMNELRRVLIVTEQKAQAKWKTETGLWIESFAPVLPEGLLGDEGMMPMYESADPSWDERYGEVYTPPPAEEWEMEMDPGMAPPPSADEIVTVHLICRAINLDPVNAGANQDLAYTFQEELKKSPLFSEETRLEQMLEDQGMHPGEGVGPDLTFGFGVTLKMEKPFKLVYGVD